MDCYDPLRYWDDRHDRSVGLAGVGCLGLNGYNDWIYRVRRRVFQRVLRPYADRLRGARVLDVGSGSGFYLAEWLRHPVGELVGSDFSGVALTRLRRSFPAIPMEPLDIATTDRGAIAKLGRFDFISAIDILFRPRPSRSPREARRTPASHHRLALGPSALRGPGRPGFPADPRP